MQKTIQPSPIRQFLPYREAARQKGLKVYDVHIGNPDLDIPIWLKESMIRVMTSTSSIPYSSSQGETSLINAWRLFYAQDSINLNATDFLITNGASEALLMAGILLFDPGDHYILFEPFYGIYKPLERLISAEPIGVLLDRANNYHLPTKKEIISRITPDVKAIVINNPNNPTGTIFSIAEVRLLIDIAVEFGLFIICDETYRGIIFENKKSFSILEIASPDELERIIVIDSMSKKLSACGLRIGALISKNQELMKYALRIAETRISVPFIEQHILAGVINKTNDYLPYLNDIYKKRRDILIDTLQELLSIKINKPEATIYTVIPLPIDNAVNFAKWLLTDFSDKNETVMVAPLNGFYLTPNQGKNEIRVALVLEEEKLKRVAQLLAIAVKKYNSTRANLTYIPMTC